MLLHEAELLGDVLLVLAIVVLGQPQEAVAEAEDVLEGGVAGAVEFLDTQHGGFPLHLGEGRLG